MTEVKGSTIKAQGGGRRTCVSETVPLQLVTLDKPHVTHGTSVRLHP